MYTAGIMDHFSDAPSTELFVWGSTVAILASSTFGAPSRLKSASLKAGDIKRSSTGSRIWRNLALIGQFGGLYLPPLVYWTTTAYNRFRQPDWMAEYALPSPPDVFGVDGVTVGRVVGLLATLTGAVLTRAAMKASGDQHHAIGIKEKPKLVDDGLFAHVRHPAYTGSLIVGASFALASWSYIPLYALPLAIGGYLLKVPIEERTISEDPELGNEYKLYKLKVPYRIIPYIW